MSKDLFDGIVSGLQEATDFFSGKKTKVRATHLAFVPAKKFSAASIRRLRAEYGLSQSALAALLAVSLDTVKAWEIGRNAPNGPSLRLLELLKRHGGHVVDAFVEEKSRAAVG